MVSDADSLALRKVTSLSDFSISGILLWISFAIRTVGCMLQEGGGEQWDTRIV